MLKKLSTNEPGITSVGYISKLIGSYGTHGYDDYTVKIIKIDYFLPTVVYVWQQAPLDVPFTRDW